MASFEQIWNDQNIFGAIFMASWICLRQYSAGINPKPADDKKIPIEAAFKFLSALPELYRDLEMIHSFCAGRIGEVSGIQISNIYLDQEFLVTKDSVVWCNISKMFEYLSPFPKNK